ncbi:hypothetical protein ACI7YT_12555 [Microbacterium sp. M]
MAKHLTQKRTDAGKARTLANRKARAYKAGAARTTASGRAR